MSKHSSLTHARLRELLEYDPRTGIFVWRVDRGGKARSGTVAGTPAAHGYITISVDSVQWRAHRLAWFWMTGEVPPTEVDHRNCRPADNRWVNLRTGEHRENQQNRRTPQSNNKSGFLGVHYDARRRRYVAVVRTNGRGKTIGRFATAEEAHAAYLTAKRELHPFNTL